MHRRSAVELQAESVLVTVLTMAGEDTDGVGAGGLRHREAEQGEQHRDRKARSTATDGGVRRSPLPQGQ
jgi:hypothetical protein